jgi:serine/threonine protein kinase
MYSSHGKFNCVLKADSSLVGQVVDGSYLITGVLGEGAFAVTYAATQLELNRQVCLKIVKLEVLTDASSFKRFRREAQVLAKLTHPNIVRVYSFGVYKRVHPYLVMEVIPGISLRQQLSEGPISWLRAVQICIQVCAGVGFAHQHGFIHRDLKPENVMLMNSLDGERARIIDFGLVGSYVGQPKQVDTITTPETILGTLNYMPPEAFKSMVSDRTLDIYAIGCILYEMLSGELPFAAPNPVAIIQKHASEKLPPLPLTVGPEYVRQGLQNIIWKCTNIRAQLRYDSCSEIMDSLDELLMASSEEENGGELRFNVAQKRSRTSFTSVRKPRAILATCLVLLLIMIVVAIRQQKPSEVTQQSNEVPLAKLLTDLDSNLSDIEKSKGNHLKKSVSELGWFVDKYNCRLMNIHDNVSRERLSRVCKRIESALNEAVEAKDRSLLDELRGLYSDILASSGNFHQALTLNCCWPLLRMDAATSSSRKKPPNGHDCWQDRSSRGACQGCVHEVIYQSTWLVCRSKPLAHRMSLLSGRLAQWWSTSFTPRGLGVRVSHRP